MELRYFLSVLSKRKWLLLLASLVAALTTAYLASFMPKKYKSGAIISTGITDYKGLRVGEQNVFVQEFEIENKFANLTETMKSRSVINGLAKKLILHDLLTDSGTVAFNKLELDKIHLTKHQVNDYVTALAKRSDSMGPETNVDLLNTASIIQKALGYDYETLRDKLEIKRVEKSDYLKVDYSASKPDLAYFTAKTYLDEFRKVYYLGKDTNQNNSVVFYNNLTTDKKRTLDSLNNLRYNYAKNHGVVALMEQSQAIVSQIKELEMVRNEEEKKYSFNLETARKYGEEQRPYAEQVQLTYKTNVFNNEGIADLGNQIHALQIKSVNASSKDNQLIQQEIETLKAKREALVHANVVDKRDEQDPVIQKNNEVFLRKADAEATRDGSKQTITTLNTRIDELQGRKIKLINDNAELGKLTQQIETAQKEYENVFDKKNQADVIKESGSKENPMKVIENPMYPYTPEASKRTLLATFAGVSAGTLGMLLLFCLSYFDRSLSSRFQYAKHIGLPLLGILNKLDNKKNNDFAQIFETEKNSKEVEYFKEALRKLRHDIETSEARSFLFVSLKPSEGKSFLIAALAHALSIKNRKVLIIDTNFKHNTLSHLSPNPFLKTGVDTTALVSASNGKAKKLDFDFKLAKVDIIGNKMSSHSPSELLSGVDFKHQVNDFSKKYDYVFLEAACLSKFSDARELVDYVDKVIPVFDATTSLTKDDDYNIQYLHDLNGKVLGSVLNKANLKNLD